MKIRVLGSHGYEHRVGQGDRVRQCRASAFLVNDQLLVDAGTVGGALTLEQQRQIRHVLISHIHFDHIQALPTMADNLVDAPERPLVLVGLQEVLKGIQTHIFNGEVFPDFLQLPDPRRPVFGCWPAHPGVAMQLGGLRVTAVPVNHQVPTVGFVIDDGASAILYSGDTYETEDLWEVASRTPHLKAAFIEASFPDDMAQMAKISLHLTPRLLKQEFLKIGRPDLPVYAYHLKSRYAQTIEGELAALGMPNLQVLEEGQELVV